MANLCGMLSRMMIRLFSWLSILFLSSAWLGAQERPNIVFLLADDLGYMDVGFNNPDTFYETPNLDGLAKSGMVFTDFYAASQVCSPTRASIFTGKYPARTATTNFASGRRSGTYAPAAFNTIMALDEVTFTETLRNAGYATFFAGKWHLGGDGHLPTDQGFEENCGGGENGGPRSYFSPYKNVQNLTPGPDGEFLTDRLSKESAAFIRRSANEERPFLLYLSFYSVHTPLQAPKRLVEKYEQKAVSLGIAEEEGSFDDEGVRQVWPGEERRRKIRVRQDHAIYAAMVESMDAGVGRVLNQLDQSGLRDNTLVVFMSDNGGLSTSEGWPTSNLPLRGGKGWIYEGGIREPVIFRWPGVTPPGTSCSNPAVSTDFYPTFLEAAGLTLLPGQHEDGISLMPLLRNPFAKFDRGPIFFHYPHYSNQGGFPASAFRDGDYKLVQDLEDGAYELYNLETDPSEHNNLEQLEVERTERMARDLNSWRKQMGARPLNRNEKTGAEPPKLW